MGCLDAVLAMGQTGCNERRDEGRRRVLGEIAGGGLCYRGAWFFSVVLLLLCFLQR